MKLLLDPGHGGKYSGAVLRNADGEPIMLEKDAALATALTLKFILKEQLKVPFDVPMTRYADEFVPFYQRTHTDADLLVSIHYDIPNGRAPIYHQQDSCLSCYIARRLNLLGGLKKEIWSTTKAAHTGGRLYIDDAEQPAILLEVDTLDKYRDDPQWRLARMWPVASALVQIMHELALEV